MDKEEALIESNIGSNSNGEFLTPFDFEDDTYSSMEEALDEANSRVTNPSEILNIRLETKMTSMSMESIP
jgi:site-specific DNA-adenine methylase